MLHGSTFGNAGSDSDGYCVTGNTDQAELGDIEADIEARALLGTCTPGK